MNKKQVVKELRVGNYIHTFINHDDPLVCPLDTPRGIKQIDVRMLLHISKTRKPKPPYLDFELIHITEEILLRLGFKSLGCLFTFDLSGGGIFAISLNDYSYGIYSSQFHFGIGSGFNSGSNKIRCVSRLQNIIYDLTEEELTLKV